MGLPRKPESANATVGPRTDFAFLVLSGLVSHVGTQSVIPATYRAGAEGCEARKSVLDAVEAWSHAEIHRTAKITMASVCFCLVTGSSVWTVPCELYLSRRLCNQ